MDIESKEIMVEIFKDTLITMEPSSIEPTIITMLKDAGIPVNGVLLFQGVSNGTLRQEEDVERGSYIFRWKLYRG